jgi:hypothetical protein
MAIHPENFCNHNPWFLRSPNPNRDGHFIAWMASRANTSQDIPNKSMHGSGWGCLNHEWQSAYWGARYMIFK